MYYVEKGGRERTKINADELYSAADRILKNIGTEKLHGFSGIYELRLAEENGDCFYAAISDGSISLGQGECPDAVCSAETDGETLEALLAGVISPAAAVMSGRVRLRGSMRELGRIAVLLRRLH